MLADLPPISFPPELPVSQRRDEIARAIRENQVVIVAGETGSGKTTQLPKICLELGRESIGHTQPRRIAARTIAERVAEELGTQLGGLVGYQVRFTDRVGSATRIKLMTDGILLAEIHRDRDLERYDTIIIDEAHERSLTIDFLLGYLKRLLPRRPELKVIVTSATIDPESFARHFAAPDGTPAPIVEVSGRTYPVEIRYRPLVADAQLDDPDALNEDDAPAARAGPAQPVPAADPEADRGIGKRDRDVFEGITDALDELTREQPGDVLVFLSGENEIRDAEDAIRGHLARQGQADRTEVLPLYGRLSAADQHRVFEPTREPGIVRRIVLATNVAETSLTVPGIKHVIDTGTARISRYSPRAKVQRLPIEPISKASANQRSGRAGRTSAGIAIRLYSQADLDRRPEYTDPEILRTNLASVILQMISLGLGDVQQFPFLQPPDARGVKDGLDLLRELGAIRPKKAGPRGKNAAAANDTRFAGHAEPADGSSGASPGKSDPALDTRGAAGSGGFAVTRIGRQLTQLPVDPRFARMVLESKQHDVTREVMVIVAGLSIQDPRERPLEKRQQADAAHARFADPSSDFLSLLNLWNHLEQQERELSGNRFRRMCKAEFLNYLRVREWKDVYRQLARTARPLGLHVGQPKVNPDGIHRSLLAGLLSHIGLKDAARRDYVGARNRRFSIFPGSALSKRQPNAVMAAELVETSRLFARTVASIDPAWAEPIAGELVKRNYGEPHWEQKQGAAVAYEKVTLFGVPIVARRRVQYGRIDPVHARELFIRHALVEGEWPRAGSTGPGTCVERDPAFEFDRANRRLREELAEVEERTRRRDILFDDEVVFEFYDRRVPDDVHSVRGFESWWRNARSERPDLLTMTERDLAGDAVLDEMEFPGEWRQGDQTLRLSYRFEPGAEDDGVTASVPLPLLARLSPAGFDWLVPGFREDLVAALIKTLPKAIRRNVVPAADWARRLLESVPEGADLAEQPITEFLAAQIQRMTYTPVSGDDFDPERLPTHLRMTFAVVDDRGRTLAHSKDLASLQHKLRTRARDAVARLASVRAVGSAAQPQVSQHAGAKRPDATSVAAAASASASASASAAASASASANDSAASEPAATSVPPAANGAIAERSGVTSWDFGVLPEYVDIAHGGNLVRAYPSLVDDGSAVGIRFLATAADQRREHPRGVRRLLVLTVRSPLGYVREHLSQNEKLVLATSPYQNVAALLDDCLLACVDAGLRDRHPDGMVFTPDQLEQTRREIGAGLIDSLYSTVKLVTSALEAARDADRALKASTSMALLPALTDAREQLNGLLFPGFVSSTGLERLRHLPRYVRGITSRIEKLAADVGRDRTWMNQVQTATARYLDAGGTIPLPADAPGHLVRARWLLEEFRISLFAQQLGTAEPASLQRITKALARKD